MTDNEIISFIKKETGFEPIKLVFSCDSFITLNFFNAKTNWVISKYKCKPNGMKIKVWNKQEMKDELKKRCAAIRNSYKKIK